jgi:drug/metabolite transporter (DMT)-like permease
MLGLCLAWGFYQVAIKLAIHDVPPLTQSAIRSFGATPIGFLWAAFTLFGIAAGYFVLGEPLTPAFAAAALMVVAGLVPVNRTPATRHQ